MRGAVQRAASALRDRRLAGRVGVAAGAVVAGSVPFVLLALLAKSEAGWLAALDRAVVDAVQPRVRADPGLRGALVAFQEVAQPWRLNAVAYAVSVGLLLRGHRRLAIWVAVTISAGWLLGWVLKLVVERARPSFPDPVELAPGWSFPSGHAVGSFVFATTMALLIGRRASGPARIAVWTAAVALVLAVGADRVALGVHYPSDVVAGWIVAAALVTATTVAFETAPPK